MKKLLTICLMLLGAVAQAQNFAITATTEASIRKNVVKGNSANYGFGMINDTLRLIGLNTRYDISTGSFSKNTVGLNNVDNTSDANKPISTATQTALNLKANIASPTFTGTVSGITKSMVGLGNVDNTSDASKPISTATQTALDLKANLASPTFTGTVAGITKAMVGLGNVDNTTDAAKPISTATQTALDAKQATLNGTGFVKSTAGTISYDNSTYLSSSTAASTYLPISNPTATGTLTAPTIANTLGANFATTSGNVGIGTASPQNLLHIKGTPSVGVGVRNSHFIIESAETAGVDVGAVLKFAGQSGNAVNPYSFGTIEGKKESALTNNYSSYLGFNTIDNTGGSNERMRINGNGNIGVGILSTIFKFHVNGGNIYVGGTGAGVRIEDRSLSSRSYQLYVDGGALAVFNHNNSTQPLTVTDGGNILVGTVTNSGYKLDVNGTARASQFYLSALNTAPASATATGTTGEIKIDASYIYICTATNVWKRSAITTW